MKEWLLRVKRFFFCICDPVQISTRFIKIDQPEKGEADKLYECVFKCQKCGKITFQYVEIPRTTYCNRKIRHINCPD